MAGVLDLDVELARDHARVDVADVAADEAGEVHQVAAVVEQRAAAGDGLGGERGPDRLLARPVVRLPEPQVGERAQTRPRRAAAWRSVAAPCDRSWWLVMSTTPAARQASIIASASARSSAIGFSQSTCTPAAAAARVAGWCTNGGGADRHRVDARFGEQRLVVEVRALDAPGGGPGRQRRGVHVGDGDDLGACRDVAVAVGLRDAADADDPHAERRVQMCSLVGFGTGSSSTLRVQRSVGCATRRAAQAAAFATMRRTSGWWYVGYVSWPGRK